MFSKVILFIIALSLALILKCVYQITDEFFYYINQPCVNFFQLLMLNRPHDLGPNMKEMYLKEIV